MPHRLPHAAPILATLLAALAPGCSVTAEEPGGPLYADLRADGRDLFAGRAGCTTCHKLGGDVGPITGPNLGAGDGQTAPLGVRAGERAPGLRPVEYVVQSIVDPDAIVVPTYARGVMKRYAEPPIALTDEEIVALALFLAGEGFDDPRAPALVVADLPLAWARVLARHRPETPAKP